MTDVEGEVGRVGFAFDDGKKRWASGIRLGHSDQRVAGDESAVEGSEELVGLGGLAAFDNDKFRSGSESEVEGDQRLSRTARVIGHEARDGDQAAPSTRLLVLVTQSSQSKQSGHGAAVSGGSGVVLDILGAGNQSFVVGRCVEEDAVVFIANAKLFLAAHHAVVFDATQGGLF